MPSDVLVTLQSVVVLSLLDENLFKLMLVNLLGRDADLHQHLN